MNYMTLGDWTPQSTVPSQVRPTWTGKLDVTWAPSSITSYTGTVVIRQSPETGFGSLNDFRLVYRATQAFAFVDHYGITHTAVFQGVMPEKSLLNMWDSATNEYHVPVTMYIVS
jgi:hypothetical protein